ncbi:MAG: hypothetical protein K0S27_1649 [Gammaproteobacteria bacterium]|jgi:hypothetical protein|nr:hypothetical protein [Gammaproteobacteria bacterium]
MANMRRNFVKENKKIEATNHKNNFFKNKQKMPELR